MKPNSYNYHNQSGMFRNKILIQKLITEVDARKQQTSKYVDFGHFFAMKKTQKGEEVLSADTEKTYIVDRFILKFSRSLDELISENGTTIRVIHKGVTYDVISAINDNNLNETLTLVGKSEVRSSEY